MNLYIRLIWTLVRCLFLPSISPTDTLVVHRRVWLTDLDINFHMNNGRYLTIVDLSLIEFFARTGFLKAAIKQKFRPMAGGSIITFRKGLSPLQSYELRFRWLCADGPWNYMGYEFVSDDRVHAAGILKGGMVGKAGLIDCVDGIRFLPEKWQSLVVEVLQTPAPPEVTAWQNAEEHVFQSAGSRHQQQQDKIRSAAA